MEKITGQAHIRKMVIKYDTSDKKDNRILVLERRTDGALLKAQDQIPDGKNFKFHGSYSATMLEFKQMVIWLDLAGAHPYDGAYTTYDDIVESAGNHGWRYDSASKIFHLKTSI